MIKLSTHAQTLKYKAALITFLTLLLTTSLSYADVYKWTDSSGNIHYSDIKPNKASSEKLNIKTTKPSQERTPPQDSAQQLDQSKAKELQSQAERLQAETNKREHSAHCQNLRDNLKTLQDNSRIKINDEGTIRFMTPEEIENKKQSYTQKINELCSN